VGGCFEWDEYFSWKVEPVRAVSAIAEPEQPNSDLIGERNGRMPLVACQRGAHGVAAERHHEVTLESSMRAHR
jgi:hypothetical protein